MTARRFPPPWSVDEENAACFIVRDHAGKSLAYVYFEEEPGRRAAAKLLTRDEARRIAANIASGLIHSGDSQIARSSSSSRHESRNCRQRHAGRSQNNADPKPFIWTADPRRVLAAVKRGKQALESVH
jgi:hypothetical protein